MRNRNGNNLELIDDQYEMYIPDMEYSLAEIVEKAQAHFNTTDLSNITISTEEIRIKCLGHDQYDGLDFQKYIILQRD